MRNWLVVAGAILLIVYLLRPHLLAPSATMPTFDDVSQKMGATELYTERRHVSEEARALPDDCDMPPVADNATLILLSAYRGQAVSNAAIASQDIETTAADIVVEPGDKPLYVVAVSFGPVIWRLTGAVDRIRHLVLAAQTHEDGERRGAPLTGVTGLARDQVAFLAHADCLGYFNKAGRANAVLTAGRVRRHVGRMPDIVAAGEAVSGFSVPSGDTRISNPFSLWRQIQDRPLLAFFGLDNSSLFRRDLRRDMTSTYPDGVARIDVSQVVASAPVDPYAVLPRYAGMQELIAEGALEDTGHDEFRIRRKLRLPAQLTSGIWLLPAGVPLPDGKPGQMCLVSEETGRAVPGFDAAGFC